MFDALKHPLLMLALAIDQNYGFYPVSHYGSVEFFKVFRGARREMWRTPRAAPSKHRDRLHYYRPSIKKIERYRYLSVMADLTFRSIWGP